MIFLGIDCGTQSTKTVALDGATGELLASASKSYDILPPSGPGAMEQRPEDWRDAANETIKQVLEKLGTRKSEVRGIGVSGQQHGLVVLDAKDEVVRPAKLWCDTSTVAQCEEVHAHFGGADKLIEMAGNPLLAGYTAPKVLWLRQNEPENWKRTTSVLLPHDYLNFWLTGEKRMEYGDASGTAFFDVRNRTWSEPIVNFLADDLADKLPTLGSSNEPAGHVRSSLLSEWGLSGSVIVSSGGGDNMMSAIGTGNTAAGVVTASLGTSGTLYAFSDFPVIDTKGEVAAFCDSTDHWMPLVCTMNVTLVTEAARKLFSWNHSDFDAAIRSVAPGSDGLLLLPYLTGERTPNLPNSTGVFHGLTTTNFTAAHIARAATEGVTLGLGYGLQRFRELGVEPTEIRVTGGGSNSGGWRQLCADVFGVPVVALESGEGAGLGAALQAAWHAGKEAGGTKSLNELVSELVRCDEATRVTPNESATAVYRESMERAKKLRTALAGDGLL
ncbi:MAG TPA: xylulokinase [Chthoniobacterales bacterium]|nr:xylulokinase [Chthoniobacterales bacterium]